eukprot:CAMPEP_0113637880 /NCGR_PEP_ID=MMETSP0017_2-20120614/19839_1 /TAXON_ID=2856 /ORGANISM="Cylindrotheca closterium" /LENGTH=501 /DNA_ID=CAMNT_0000548951 /DNA_START=143 /DNA_END=1645 /DNA_ORIENTATION=- /assembly_acc=CAM_ASM_000147
MTCQWSAAVAVDETDLIAEETAPIAYDWDDQFKELLSFQAKYFHCNFPQNAPVELTKKFPTLARFCHDQRLEYKRLYNNKFRSDKMTLPVFDRDVRCRHLEEVGFEFDMSSAQWYDKYHDLLEYRNGNGHVRVKREENTPLYHWVISQRIRRNKGKHGYALVSEAQVTLLDNIGFEWESELYDELWNAKYNELVDFRKKHGHLEVEMRGPLYDWMNHQRKRRDGKKRHAPLSDEQIRLLDDIEFPWIPNRYEAKWYAKYNELARFQKEHGHCRPTKPTHAKLYEWSKDQRKKRQKGLLSVDQIEQLDKIDFPWEANTTKWIEMYRELKDHHNDKGHLRVGQDDNSNLYDWMDAQRTLYHGIVKKPIMADIQIEKLEEISFCWSLDGKERAWHEKYTEAVELYKEHGHIRVTKKNKPSLYNWIQSQVKRYKGQKGHKPLSEEELELLEQIDFPIFENQPRMAWTTMFADLVKYQKENDGRFPTSHKDDPDLNRWMRHQRSRM